MRATSPSPLLGLVAVLLAVAAVGMAQVLPPCNDPRPIPNAESCCWYPESCCTGDDVAQFADKIDSFKSLNYDCKIVVNSFLCFPCDPDFQSYANNGAFSASGAFCAQAASLCPDIEGLSPCDWFSSKLAEKQFGFTVGDSGFSVDFAAITSSTCAPKNTDPVPSSTPPPPGPDPSPLPTPLPTSASTPLPPPPPPSGSDTPVPAPDEDKHWWKWAVLALLIIGGVVIVGAIIGAVVYFYLQKKKKLDFPQYTLLDETFEDA